ncbi:DEAD-domain-containing protein [Phlegmacium glaucopus]|nr:DEAD-domain-containing protein [Phlegmacium glaucopus]
MDEPKIPAPAHKEGRHFTNKRFADAPISPASRGGIKHEFMSDVQAATLDLALTGKDLLVQAKTGTGKTLAFLLPAIERLLKRPNALQGTSILVLSPTRELVLQIEKEAKVLLARHPFEVQHVMGGTNQNAETKLILSDKCHILIATPGRLLDHLRTTTLAERLANLQTVVFDEADRLLDQGFKKDLNAIMEFLPPKEGGRQSLLFSATISQEIKKIAIKALRPGYSFVSTLLADELNTHQHVSQSYVITPQHLFLPTLVPLLRSDKALHPSASKVMVFFPTARQVGLAAEVLLKVDGLEPIHEIHSRLSQAKRTSVAQAFTKAKTGVLLSSDVTARGMDFPGVTLVIQLGVPANPEQYIHRLGRTARAGAVGRGILVLSQEESFFLETSKTGIGALPIEPLSANSTPPGPTSETVQQAHAQLQPILEALSDEEKGQAYRAWMGYYNSFIKRMGWKKADLIREAGLLAVSGFGWTQSKPPPIEPRTVGMMGLKGVAGLNIVRKEFVPNSKKAEATGDGAVQAGTSNAPRPGSFN